MEADPAVNPPVTAGGAGGPNNNGENLADNVCPECGFVARSRGGLSLHRRRIHPVVYHSETEARHMARNQRHWSVEETDRLALAEARCIVDGSFRPATANQQLHEAMPARTVASIKTKRRSPAYKQLVITWVTQLREQRESLPEVHSEQPELEEVAMQRLLQAVVGARGTGDASCFGSALLENRFEELLGNWDTMSPADIKTRTAELVEEHAAFLIAGGDSRSRRPGSQRRPTHSARVHTHPPGRNSGRRGRRREMYKRVQALFNLNRSRAAKLVLSGNWDREPTPPVQGLYPFWRNVFETAGTADPRPVVKIRSDDFSLLAPITSVEVQSCLKATKDSAVGPDQLPLRVLKAISPCILAKVFNLWLIAETFPKIYRKSATTLIPKLVCPEVEGDYRPISVASHLARLFSKILAKRISVGCPIKAYQKAFVPVDGCAENLVILQAVISQAKDLRSSAHMAFLDLAKAFDSVSWDSVRRAMVRAGVPPPLVRTIMSSYTEATSCLYVDGAALGEVRLARGVKQGDPLSPILFNLVMDMVLASLDHSPVGVQLGASGEKARVLAFADDLVLCASSEEGLQESLSTLVAEMERCGLNLNPRKCKVLSLRVDRKLRKWYVSTSTAISIRGGITLPLLGPQEVYKYLGVKISAEGLRQSYGSTLEDGLAQIRNAPLKPQQRLYLVRCHLIPKLLHVLVLGKVFKTQLQRMDTALRVAIRSFLRLPSDTADAVVHAAPADGGLGIPELTSTVRLMKQRRMERMLTSTDDPLTRVAAMSGPFVMDQRYWSGAPRVKGVPCPTRSECSSRWKAALGETVDGGGIVTQIHEYRQGSNWVRSCSRLLSGRDFISAMGVRCATLPTPLRKSRGTGGAAGATCFRCRNQVASLGHISQVCSGTHGARVKRHDNIARFLAGRLKQRGFTVVEEPRFAAGRTFLKPDLVIWSEGSDRALVMDVKVASDRFPLRLSHEQKKSKYNTPEILEAVVQLTGCANVTCSSATLSWRGCWHDQSVRDLKGCGLTDSDLTICAVKALTWTSFMFKTWTRTGGHEGVPQGAVPNPDNITAD